MTVGELAAWLAAALSVVSIVLIMLGARRLGRLERRFKGLTVGAGPGADAMSLTQLVSSQASRVDNMYAEAAQLSPDCRGAGAAGRWRGAVRWTGALQPF